MIRYHYTYKIIDPINGEYYYGSRTTHRRKHILPKKDIKYMGSYITWIPIDTSRLIKKILKTTFKTREDALVAEAKLITNHIRDPLCMNKHIPGKGWHNVGYFLATDIDGNRYLINKLDPRYLSGELFGINKDKVTARNKDNKIFKVDKNDYRILSGELKYKPKIPRKKVIDGNGNMIRIRKDDPYYIKYNLNRSLKNTTIVKNKYGKKFRININDPRYLSGELIPFNSGRINVKDKNGRIFVVEKDDYRYLTGELQIPKKKDRIRYRNK